MAIISLRPLFEKGLGPTQPVADEVHLETLVNWLPSPNGLVPLGGTRQSRGLGISTGEVINVDGDYVLIRQTSTSKNIVAKYNSSTTLDSSTVTTPVGAPNIAQLSGKYLSTNFRFAFSYNTNAGNTEARTKIDDVSTPVAPFRLCTSIRNRLLYARYAPESGVNAALDDAMTLLYGANPYSSFSVNTVFWSGIDDPWISGFTDFITNPSYSPYVTKINNGGVGVFLPIGDYISRSITASATVDPPGVVSVVRSLTPYNYYRVTTEGHFDVTALPLYRVERFPLDVGFYNFPGTPIMMTNCSDECVFVHTAQGIYMMAPVADQPVFSMRRISNVESATLVAKCGIGEHVFVDANKKVFVADVNGTVKSLDYKWLLSLHGAVSQWAVFYSHLDDCYFINDFVTSGASVKTTVVNKYGAATTDVPIRGCTNSNYYSDALGNASCKTSMLTLETPQTKRLNYIRVESSGTLNVTVRVREHSTAAVRTVVYNATPDPMGIVPVDVSGFSFSIEVSGTNTVRLSDVKLDFDITSKSSYAGARKGLY